MMVEELEGEGRRKKPFKHWMFWRWCSIEEEDDADDDSSFFIFVWHVCCPLLMFFFL